MGLGRGRLVRVLAIAVGVVVLATTVRGHAAVRRLAERGPAALVVGGIFTVASPPTMLFHAVKGESIRLSACRFGHGLKMLVAGTVLLPAGLVLAPFDLGGIPGGWMDGIVDSMQEDYCTRPLTSVFP